MKMSIVVATNDIGRLNASLPGWLSAADKKPEVVVVNGTNEENKSVVENLSFLKFYGFFRKDPEPGCGVMKAMYEGFQYTLGSVVAFLHDDLIIHEVGWDKRVIEEFKDPKVGMVGFVGAVAKAELMKYGPWVSNSDDAEYFGKRITDSCDVEHLDGQSLIVRRKLLDKNFEFNNTNIAKSTQEGFYYDNWLSDLIKRQGYRLRCVGVRSYHVGWLKGNGKHNRKMELA